MAMVEHTNLLNYTLQRFIIVVPGGGFRRGQEGSLRRQRDETEGGRHLVGR